MTWHAYAIETEFDNEVNSMRLFSDWTKDYEKAGADFAAEQLESEFEDACETARNGAGRARFNRRHACSRFPSAASCNSASVGASRRSSRTPLRSST
ncbi:MAG: hypothetical protein V4793_11135 [Paraburkholderia tropica]|uniref:hypothetical protein n=1 Tax=Paraburkholderia tropica TaxID=92647 RepID=UPI003101A88A